MVKSQKDRKWDSIREGIVRIRNARKNSDWPMIQDEFANVNKMVEKSKMLIIQSGLPLFYVKMLAEVEDHVQLALKDKETIKKMKPVVSRALNQMKLQVRKHNETYKDEIADCRANPEKYQEVEEEESSSSSSSDSDSDSDESGSDSDSDASSESEKPKAKPAAKPAAKKEKVHIAPSPVLVCLCVCVACELREVLWVWVCAMIFNNIPRFRVFLSHSPKRESLWKHETNYFKKITNMMRYYLSVTCPSATIHLLNVH